MEPKSTKVIYVTNIPEIQYSGRVSSLFQSLEEQIKKLPINKCLVEEYTDRKSANKRAVGVRAHFTSRIMKNCKLNVALRKNNSGFNVYLWKTKEIE